MRKSLIQFLSGLVAVGFCNGCVNAHHAAARGPATPQYPSGEVAVVEPPPVPRQEYHNNAPDQEHLWTAGYWTCTDGRWVWIPGHWEMPPHQGAVWVPGHWDTNPSGSGSIWADGHWD